MPNARTRLTVTFEEAMERSKGYRRSELMIRYQFLNVYYEMVVVKSLKVSTLFKDWYDECNFCPANDTPASKVHILINPDCTALDISEDVPFGHLMERIEEITTGHMYCA